MNERRKKKERRDTRSKKKWDRVTLLKEKKETYKSLCAAYLLALRLNEREVFRTRFENLDNTNKKVLRM